MKQNLSSVYKLRDFGSGQILQPRQLYLSPGLAKIAPWCLAHRDNFSAEAPGHVNGWAAPPTLSAHTRWPLTIIRCKSIHSASRTASNFIHRDKTLFRCLSICTATLNWFFPYIVSGDKFFCRDNFLRQPHKLANAHIKNWLPATFC